MEKLLRSPTRKSGGNFSHAAPELSTAESIEENLATVSPSRRLGFLGRAGSDWERRYRILVVAGDVSAILVAVAAAFLFGLLTGNPAATFGLAAVCAGVVLVVLPASRAWTQRALGEGAEEYRRLGQGLIVSAVVIGFIGLLVGDLAVRPWLFVVVPLIAVVLFLLRYSLRRLLHSARRHGQCLLPIMAAGSVETIRDLIARTRAGTHVGWQVAAACTGSERDFGQGIGDIDGVPVVGRLEDVAEFVQRGNYRVLAVTADQHWNPRRLQQLAWNLEGTGAEMVVAPVLMEVAGPRLHVSGVLGMPLLRVAAPAFTGGRRVVKEIVDRVLAVSLLAVLAPALFVVSLAIKIGDRGPILFRQRRVGRDGTVFTILKFRTMVENADAIKSQLVSENETDGPLFKLRRDPRITRIGSFLRRYSLDELPQLVNVLTGQMSLVGPRPPLPEETEAYESDVRRRLLVKPGLTGLWQVSGRSDLTWAESVRLDLRYVEDWSLALDLVILWKTVRAVLVGEGAY